jgi:hypothetical protein
VSLHGDENMDGVAEKYVCCKRYYGKTYLDVENNKGRKQVIARGLDSGVARYKHGW